MDHLDVLVVGGGPVGIIIWFCFLVLCNANVCTGLITAYQLAKFGGVKVQIIEKFPKSDQDQYG